MHKIRLIIEREFMSRVRKKTFLIMTLLGPLLIAGISLLPVWLAMRDNTQATVYVSDETGWFSGHWKSDADISFRESNEPEAGLRKQMASEGEQAYLLVIYRPGQGTQTPGGRIFGSGNPPLSLVRSIETQMNEALRTRLLKEKGIDAGLVESIKPSVDLKSTILQGEEEKEGSSTAATAIGFGSGFLIYIFIFLYGSQVMSGVMEEKNNRVVEIIISSVRPFELMIGKIIGVALVGLFQFVLWMVLSFGLTSVAGQFISMPRSQPPAVSALKTPDGESVESVSGKKETAFFRELSSVNVVGIILYFLFYFFGGYLLYSALFAAVGAAVDNQQDAQQFMLPVTLPVIVSIILGQFIIEDPNGALAFWFSVIPFTSPIIMMIRIPFEPPLWQILLSMGALVLGFLGTTWLAGRIYRVGILMYGKKVTYRELWKWMRYPA